MPPQEPKFNFEHLFTFEMANNHQGSVAHGKRIMAEVAAVAEPFGIRRAIKFQFRDLDTFIHPSHRAGSVSKHIPRFLATRLTDAEFAELAAEAKRLGFITMCTPFDEASVDKVVAIGFDILKIASCSAHDWPLLERAAAAGKPMIVSTGGLALRDVDRVVSFLEHRGAPFALMHCVAIYPTPMADFHLNQIELMRNRYPGVAIGFSTHEAPENLTAIQLAYAKGARIFEKHVGVPTEEIKLNAYSASPEQVGAWLTAWRDARDACGSDGERAISERERADIASLMRGVFAKKFIRRGDPIARGDVYFAMPIAPDQLSSGEWRERLTADRDYAADEGVSRAVLPAGRSRKEIIYSTIHAVKAMLHAHQVPLNHDFSVELSHHYGLERFHEVGCTLIECVNREYAKKIIVQLAGQWNPVHYHKKKDETFQVLAGTLEVELEGRLRRLEPGDTLWVPRGIWHGFRSQTGAIFEEISTTSLGDDSFYIDRTIAALPRESRKTRLYNWGRHQFDEFDERGEIVGQYA